MATYKTVKIDVEKLASNIWDRFMCDLEASMTTIKDKSDLYNETYEDARAAKYSLDVLRWAKLITAEECDNMQQVVDKYVDDMFINRAKGNKED